MNAKMSLTSAFATRLLQSIDADAQLRSNRTQTQAVGYVSLNLREIDFHGSAAQRSPGTRPCLPDGTKKFPMSGRTRHKRPDPPNQ
jgi:hypothetical protein